MRSRYRQLVANYLQTRAALDNAAHRTPTFATFRALSPRPLSTTKWPREVVPNSVLAETERICALDKRGSSFNGISTAPAATTTTGAADVLAHSSFRDDGAAAAAAAPELHSPDKKRDAEGWKDRRSATAAKYANFRPLATYTAPNSIPRTWFHGHAQKASHDMAQKYRNSSRTPVVVSVRDMRVPISSWNPSLDLDLRGGPGGVDGGAGGDRDWIIVYSKADLCASDRGRAARHRLLETHARLDPGVPVFFLDLAHQDGDPRLHARALRTFVRRIRQGCLEHAGDHLAGCDVVVSGVPNVGKSTLLNRLARLGHRVQGRDVPGKRTRRKNVARTGDHPGVTRKLEQRGVRFLEPGPDAHFPEDPGLAGPVYAVDSPGIGVRYMPDPEEYLKLALCNVVPATTGGAGTGWRGLAAETLAEYLLHHMNRRDPSLYRHFLDHPTNDVEELLAGVGKRTGRFRPEQAATWLVQCWRRGELGRFPLEDGDDIGLEAFQARREQVLNGPLSVNQAQRQYKVMRAATKVARMAADKAS